MKVYFSKMSFLYILIFSVIIVYLSSYIFFTNFLIIIQLSSLAFFIIGGLLFQIQKINLIKQLAEKSGVYPPRFGFIFNNGIFIDIFESFLIIGKNKLVVCTANHPLSLNYNKLIKKESYIKYFENNNELIIEISKKKGDILIRNHISSEKLSNIPYSGKLEDIFIEFDYNLSTYE